MIRLTLLLLLSGYSFSQTLPKVENGLAISYNYSQRYIEYQSFIDPKPIFFISGEYKRTLNLKNNLTLKTGISLFITGHKGIAYHNKSAYNYKNTYYYTRIPLLFSFNIKSYYIDFGPSVLFRFYNEPKTINSTRGGDDISSVGFSAAAEIHIGKYIPLKSGRIFIELATYGSEFLTNINFPNDYYYYKYQNNITQNIQLSIGYMFGKTKVDSKSNESKD